MMAFPVAMTHAQLQVLLEIGDCFKVRGFLPHHPNARPTYNPFIEQRGNYIDVRIKINTQGTHLLTRMTGKIIASRDVTSILATIKHELFVSTGSRVTDTWNLSERKHCHLKSHLNLSVRKPIRIEENKMCQSTTKCRGLAGCTLIQVNPDSSLCLANPLSSQRH
jgi:hypothetical protein